jgi:N-acetylglucosamine-6-sulfatase
MGRRSLGRTVASAVFALVVLLVAAFVPSSPPRPDRRPNIVLILTDDQSPDSLPHEPPVMPQLQSMMRDPADHWITFSNAFVNTPLCCPSRASILTGRYSHHTGVRTNDDGELLDESSTIATWLHSAGYHTGMIGKYVNGYPFGPSSYVPAGWDRWKVKRQGDQSTAYYRYVLIDQGFSEYRGDGPGNYSTDVYAAAAASFIRSAPPGRPFFLEVATTAPHRPWTAAPRDAGALTGLPIANPPSLGEEDVSDKPTWVQGLRELDTERRAELRAIHRRSFETLLSVDDLVVEVIRALQVRGDLANTVLIFMTDNGFSFGEHRWVGKTCAYDECIRTPFLVRFPGASSHVDRRLVSNVDLAPTLAELAGIEPPSPVDGMSLVPLLQGRPSASWRTALLTEYVGDEKVPPWWAVRTEDFAYVELATGETELYDLAGVIGSADTFELENRADDPAYATVRAQLSARLVALRAG